MVLTFHLICFDFEKTTNFYRELESGRSFSRGIFDCLSDTQVCLPGLIPCFLGLKLISVNIS